MVLEKRCSKCSSNILIPDSDEEEWKKNNETCIKCRKEPEKKQKHAKKEPEKKEPEKMPIDVLRIAYEVLLKSRDQHNKTVEYFMKTFKDVYDISFYDVIDELDVRQFEDSSEFLYYGFHKSDGDLSFEHLDKLVRLQIDKIERGTDDTL